MIQGLTVLLLFQSLGEAVAQLTGAPVPGPVIGLVALLAVLVLRQRRGKPVWVALAQAADGLLAHLSIFFIPAAVGVMLYWEPLAREGLAWIVALVGSTVAAIAVTAWFLRNRLGSEGEDKGEDEPVCTGAGVGASADANVGVGVGGVGGGGRAAAPPAAPRQS